MKPHFTLRDLFWLIALVAMACAWWVEHWNAVANQEVLRAEIRRLTSIWPLIYFEEDGMTLNRGDEVEVWYGPAKSEAVFRVNRVQ